MKKRMIPWSTAEESADIPMLDSTTLLPFSSMANSAETTTITAGLRSESQAMIMAVNPTPPATPTERVASAPETWTIPPIPQIPPAGSDEVNLHKDMDYLLACIKHYGKIDPKVFILDKAKEVA